MGYLYSKELVTISEKCLREEDFVLVQPREGFSKTDLAFSGGGVCGVAHAGVITALEELGVYSQFYNFTGASVGSIVAALCAVKATAAQIQACMDFDFQTLLDDDYGIVRDNLRLWYECGYYKGDALLEKIRHSLQAVCGNADLKFHELEAFGTTLQIPVTLVWQSHSETKIYSALNTPQESIALACRMSCTYPAKFRSLNSTTDGGLLCNYPIHLLRDGYRLGVRFQHPQPQEQIPVQNLGEYLASIIATLHARCEEHMDPENTIVIPVSVQSTDFAITEEQRRELFRQGYEQTLAYFK